MLKFFVPRKFSLTHTTYAVSIVANSLALDPYIFATRAKLRQVFTIIPQWERPSQ